MSYKVVRVKGSHREDIGVYGSYYGCAAWCESYDWVDQDLDGFIWGLMVVEDK